MTSYYSKDWLKQKYGDKIEGLEHVKQLDYQKHSSSPNGWVTVDLRKIESPYYPFYYALKLFSANIIKIEKCRVLHDYSVQSCLLEAVIEAHDEYFEFLLDVFGLECFEPSTNNEQYGVILKLLARFKKTKLLKCVCELLLKHNRLSMINTIIKNEFQYLESFYVNNANYTGTCVHEAVFNCSTECLRILLEYGAETNIKDSNGMYPWQLIFYIDNTSRMKFNSLLQLEMILLKNTLQVMPKKLLLSKFEVFINYEYNKPRFVKNFAGGNESELFSKCKFIDYFLDLIKSDEYHSLKHYARNYTRNYRIDNNSLSTKKNTKCIFDEEKQFFF